jgi:hypothetical protein
MSEAAGQLIRSAEGGPDDQNFFHSQTRFEANPDRVRCGGDWRLM